MAFIKTDNLKGDLFGGITAGIVALPLALAFGIQAFGGIDDPSASSMGALAGLVGATFLGFFASLFGGTHSQISGPTGPMTVITASLLSGVWAAQHSMSAVLISMSLAGLFCGLFQILFGILKIGKYVRYIPYPVLSGFMSGIGVIIIIQQLYPLIGCKSPVLVVDMITQLPERVAGGVSFTALLLGLGTIAIIYLFPLITKKIPSTLVALLVMTVVSLFLGMDEKLLIGQIPSGFPMPFFAKEGLSLSGLDWGAVLKASVIPGLTLAGLGSIDTLLTSVVADNITKTHHNSNRELVGQGIGNIVSGLFCGISGAGATMRTVVNVKSGGRTQISGMVHSLMLLAVLLGLGSLVRYVPLAVLAGILITVGWGIIDFKGFKDLLRIPRADAVVLIIVFLLTVFVDLLTAVGIGMVIAKGTENNALIASMTVDDETHQALGNAANDKATFEPLHLVIDETHQISNPYLFNLDLQLEGTKAEGDTLNITGSFTGNGSATFMGQEQIFEEVSGTLSGKLVKQQTK